MIKGKKKHLIIIKKSTTPQNTGIYPQFNPEGRVEMEPLLQDGTTSELCVDGFLAAVTCLLNSASCACECAGFLHIVTLYDYSYTLYCC